MGRICKNDITDHIRDHFGANPLKAPEARIQPLCMLEIDRNKPSYLGEFKYLVKNGFPHDVPIQEEPVASVSDKQSKITDFETGFQILSGFLKVLGVDPASVGAAFKKSKKMAFSFQNVRRRYIDPLQFGMILSQNNVLGDPDNFILSKAIKDKKVQLGLITDVMVSNNFSISTFSESEIGVDVEVPLIQQAISGLNINVKVNKTAENVVAFEAPYDLSFAFSALELIIDAQTGKFSRGNWMKNLKSARGEQKSFENLTKDDMHLLERLEIDNNREYPLLIEL